MKNIKRFLVLENDIESQGLPDILKDCLDVSTDIPYEVWWWFNQSVIQETKKSFERFKKVKPDTLLITYPSFVGYDNSFESKLRLFKELKDQGIKIKIGVLYYKSFYWFLVKWLHEYGAGMGDFQKKKKEIEILKECLAYHHICYFTYEDVSFKDVPILDAIKRITWKSLEKKYFPEKQKFKINKTGEIKTVYNIYINTDYPEKSHIGYATETKKGSHYSSSNDLKLSEITKI